MKEGGHLVTIDCGTKEGHVREFLKEKKVDESVWTGLNKVYNKKWNWHNSDSSSYSYANFINGRWPTGDDNCVLMKR